MKKSTKNKIENNLKLELYDFMKKYGITEINFGSHHKLKIDKKNNTIND